MLNVKPPQSVIDTIGTVLFLAGSIEQGKAEDWQQEVYNQLLDLNGTILNPRRDDWDSTQEQTVDNPYMVEQIYWELNGIDLCDFVFFNFCGGTISPISLMELGMMTDQENVIVRCDENYFRRANVEIFCSRCAIPFFTDFDDAIYSLRRELTDNFEV